MYTIHVMYYVYNKLYLDIKITYVLNMRYCLPLGRVKE